MLETIPAERVVSDVETLKAISDPVRLRILEAMISEPGEPWTVRRLAAAVGSAPTRLYHHIKVLEDRNLITVAGTRVVQGIIETSYRPAQLSLRLDRALLSSGDPATAEPAHAMLVNVFDGARAEIEDALRSGRLRAAGDDERRGLVQRGRARLTGARAAELRERLKALLDEFDGDDGPDAEVFGVLIALYPVAPAAEEATDD